MKISLITATYNSEATIRDTLECVKEQTYQEIEHIIVDGNSTDNTLNIVKEYPHVNKIISESDKGLYDAMNKGIQLATGTIIGILNSDDFYANASILTNVVDKMIQQDSDALYGDLQYVDQLDTSKIVRNWKAGNFKRNKFLNGWMPPHPTFFVKKDVYLKYGDFALSLKSAADYEIMLRFLYRHEISVSYLPEVLVKMRTGGQSNVSLHNRILANKEDKLAWYINNIQPRFYTTWLKPLRKIPQFIKIKNL